MEYEWDKDKAEANKEKHGIAFPDAVLIFEDDAALTLEDPDPDEERFITIGLDALGRILVVVYTLRGEHIRLFRRAGQHPVNASSMKVRHERRI